MLDDLPSSVNLHCPFCFSTEFQFEEGQEFQDGDLVICANCGKECDYTAMVDVTKENAREMINESMAKDNKNMLKKYGWKLN